MRPLIIANWKMNLTFNEAISLTQNLQTQDNLSNLIIAPPIPYIAYLKEKFEQLNFCAQDVSVKNNFGSFTGENTAKFFKSCNVNYAIIGHSERRYLLNETNEIIRIKAQNCFDNYIIPIICIGESYEHRQNNTYKEFLLEQLEKSLPTILDQIIIAYEPIWTIGTGVVPTIDEISEIFGLIKEHFYIRKEHNINVENKIHLVYGGSVNSKNSKELIKLPTITGLMVGGASLNKNELFKILNL